MFGASKTLLAVLKAAARADPGLNRVQTQLVAEPLNLSGVVLHHQQFVDSVQPIRVRSDRCTWR